MKEWQKTLLDPAAYTVLTQLTEPKKKEELAEATGIQTERIQEILEKLEEHDLIDYIIDSGVRKYELNNNYHRIKQLRIEIEDHTTREVENAVKAGNFQEARKKVHGNPPVENIHKRRTIAKIEALQKLEQLPKTRQEKQIGGRWQSLKGFIPRL